MSGFYINISDMIFFFVCTTLSVECNNYFLLRCELFHEVLAASGSVSRRMRARNPQKSIRRARAADGCGHRGRLATSDAHRFQQKSDARAAGTHT